jgi:Zn-dependent protease
MEVLASKVLSIAVMVILVIYAVVFHEVSHGLAAVKLGDPTPKNQKRLTLNPFRHLDFFGSVLVPLFGILLLGFAFGWAKPVIVERKNLRDPRRDMAWVGLAGPLANFGCAIIAGLIIRLIISFSSNPSNLFFLISIALLSFFVFINLLLGLFNLIPLPPLDGGHIVCAVLPEKISEELQMAGPPLFFIILFFFFTFGASVFLPLINFLHHLLTGLTALR